MTNPPDELVALRARAYGPRADIQEDPEALRRLHDLEAQARRDAAAADAPRPEPAPDVDGADTGTAVAAEDADTRAEDAPPQVLDSPRAAPAARPVRRGWIIAWAASVLAVAVAVGATVFALASVPPVPDARGLRQIATLSDPIDATELIWPQMWFGEASDPVAFEFEGLVIVRAGGGWAQDGAVCLTVVPADGYDEASGGITGNVYSGLCTAGDLPAMVQFAVTGSDPLDLTRRFPLGTGLRFVLDSGGEAVGVYVDERGARTPDELGAVTSD